jgi:SNF2 family DNA or RNA helicase
MKDLSIDYVKSQLSPFIHAQTKQNVAGQIELPIQKSDSLIFPFKSIEELYYNDLYGQAKDEIDTAYKAYMTAVRIADAEDERTLVVRNADENRKQRAFEILQLGMRTWLLRLRQTCCHPRVATANRVF